MLEHKYVNRDNTFGESESLRHHSNTVAVYRDGEVFVWNILTNSVERVFIVDHSTADIDLTGATLTCFYGAVVANHYELFS